MAYLILCIDDEPIRYRKLRRLTFDHGMVVVTTCRLEDVEEYFRSQDEIVGICLDHDMPTRTGEDFAYILREKNFPVVVTSMNETGARKICSVLSEYETPNIYLPCYQPNWENEALAFWKNNGT